MQIKCSCGEILKISEALLGKDGMCPNCFQSIKIEKENEYSETLLEFIQRMKKKNFSFLSIQKKILKSAFPKDEIESAIKILKNSLPPEEREPFKNSVFLTSQNIQKKTGKLFLRKLLKYPLAVSLLIILGAIVFAPIIFLATFSSPFYAIYSLLPDSWMIPLLCLDIFIGILGAISFIITIFPDEKRFMDTFIPPALCYVWMPSLLFLFLSANSTMNLYLGDISEGSVFMIFVWPFIGLLIFTRIYRPR